MKNDASCPCEGSSLVGFIQPIILSLLEEGPCHGYVLMQNIGRTRLWKDNRPDAAGVYRALKDMENRLGAAFGVKATIAGSEKKGKITFCYHSREELDSIYTLLEKLEE